MKPLAPILLALLVSLQAHPASGQQNCQPIWTPTFGSLPGTNDVVRAMAVFDDGSGAGPALYVGGSFTTAALGSAMHIAKWDGSSWSEVGGGVQGSGVFAGVSALAVFDDGSGAGPALYAGGAFTSAGGVPANKIAKWDGASWSPLGSGVNWDIHALTVFDDGSGAGPALYAGGESLPGAGGIAKWDGSSWSPLGTGMGGGACCTGVETLLVFDDGLGAGPALYAGGNFTTAGGVAANNIAKWDGSLWSALGSGVGGGLERVRALTVFDDGSGPALFVGGFFTTAGGTGANRIAKWDGSLWSALGSGVGGGMESVRALAVFDDGSGAGPSLYAAGEFSIAGSEAHIAKWDGASWSPLGGGISGFYSSTAVEALTVFDDGSGSAPALYAGGEFFRAGEVRALFIARWDASGWSPVGSGMSDLVLALTVFDDTSGAGPALYAGGGFTHVGRVAARRIAKWDGTSWSPLGSGMSGSVHAMAVFDDGGGPALYAGGQFTFANGVAANRIAKWDGTSWSALGSGVGVNATAVYALTVFDDGLGGGPALYAGGAFTTAGAVAANNIAKWDGVGWSALGSGMGAVGSSPSVHALTVFDDGGGPALYAGGAFTSAGGVPANYIAKWDGTSWSPLGTGMVGSVCCVGVDTLTVFDDGLGAGPALYAGGSFASAGGVQASHIAKWDGSGWSALGGGVSGVSGIRALTAFDHGAGPALYAAGEFTAVAGGLVSAKQIAKWDGTSWSALASGMNLRAHALTVFEDGSGGGPALYVGGLFTLSASGDSFLAKWGCAPTGKTLYCTAKAGLICGTPAISTFGLSSASQSSGFVILAGPARSNKSGLILYTDSGRNNQPFLGGTLCVGTSPLRRGPALDSGGFSPCDGEFALDMNAFSSGSAGGNPAAFLSVPGSVVNVQWWGRDSLATGSFLSDALEYSVGL